MVKYGDGTKAQAGEHTFVVPRTVIRIEAAQPPQQDASRAGAGGKPTAAAPGKPGGLSFTPVPLPTDEKGGALKKFSITDDSHGGFNWVATTVSSVTYADDLIVQSIGTVITDNRKAIIDAVFGIAGTIVGAGVFAADVPKPAEPEPNRLN